MSNKIEIIQVTMYVDGQGDRHETEKAAIEANKRNEFIDFCNGRINLHDMSYSEFYELLIEYKKEFLKLLAD